MELEPNKFLLDLFKMAVDAASPHHNLEKHLPENRGGKAIVIGAGKAAAAMARVFEDHWRGDLKGLVVVPYGHGDKCEKIEIIEASHPTPDQNSQAATRKILALTKGLSAEDKVYILLSGGGSSLLSLPAGNIDFSEKQLINKALLKSGATINEINCVRKHLSAIKGGKLAKHCYPAKIYSYAISDVMGDDPSVIASGPTVGDPTTSSDALNILEKYKIPNTVKKWLSEPASETIKPDDPLVKNSHYKIIYSAHDMLSLIEDKAKQEGFDYINLGEHDGEARELAINHAELIKSKNISKPTLIFSGGETTVTVKGNGRGGRNCEYLLSLAIALSEQQNIYALAADTDGIDGMEDNAGAIITPDTLMRAEGLNLSLPDMLDNNDSYSAFKMLGDLITTGPTRTNINDLRAILILPEK